MKNLFKKILEKLFNKIVWKEIPDGGNSLVEQSLPTPRLRCQNCGSKINKNYDNGKFKHLGYDVLCEPCSL